MKPKMFIGSSLEGANIANALQRNLNYEAWATVWTQAFPLSQTTIDTLLIKCAENDFAIFVFSDDDLAKMRGEELKVTRDNVIFEAGLFMGMHGKEQCFIVVPQKVENFHLPSD